MDIKKIWECHKEWVTKWEGSANEVYFINVEGQKIEYAVKELKKDASFLSIGSYREKKTNESEWDLLKEYLLSKEDTPGNVIIDCSIELSKFDFKHRIIIWQGEIPGTLFDVNIIWYADEAFQNKNNAFPRFEAIFQYFYRVKDFLGRKDFYIAPENPNNPRIKDEEWTKIS